MDGLMMPPPAGLPLLPRQRAYTHSPARLQSRFDSQRAAFGPAATRASCSERLHGGQRSRAAPAAASAGATRGAAATLAAGGRGGALYRSNSSLELEPAAGGGGLRREFGSHGSIDAIGGDAAFAVLTEFRSLDPELAAAREAARDADEGDAADASPRLRSRLQRLWDRDRRGSRKAGGAEQSLFRKLRGSVKESPRVTEPETTRSSDSLDGEARQEERRRRRALVHYDCQSLRVSLSTVARRRGHLDERRNTATGASAASKPAWRAELNADDPAATAAAADMSEDEDRGDDRSNDLVQSCPFFRNELGGERDRALHMTPGSSRRRRAAAAAGAGAARSEQNLHRPPSTCGLSVLEQPPGLTHWPAHVCPFSRPGTAIEHSNVGSYYYKDFFHGREHETWVGTDESLGPVAVSVQRDRLQDPSREGDRGDRLPAGHTCYRIIVRSSELPTLRGLILEESLCPLLKPGEKLKRLPVREILDHVAPELQASCLRLAVAEPCTEDYLTKLDEQYIFNRYKVGIMYCRAGQSTEEEMYNNEESSPALDEFLEMLGQRVRLKGFDKYKAGLDNKTDSTGQYSVYVKHQGNEIMFHVSTLLQFSPNNRQQLLRKRYIGNDIVTIIFQEPGALPFTPKHIRSQFQHVFIVVRVLNPCSENTQYSVAVNRFRDVPPFGPPIPEAATFTKSQAFAEFLYAKVINAENAAYHSEKFMTMAKRTRHEYLKDLATNYLTETMLDAPQKFSIMSFGSRKKDRPRPRFNADAVQRGAICWQVLVEEQTPSKQVECVLGVSADSIVLVEEATDRLVFAAPSASVLGWTLQGSGLRLYYHVGECVVLHPQTTQDTEELAEIAARLAAVTTGCDSQEMVLRRNQLGQLGFHVQIDGLVTEVERSSPAWQAGLRQGATIVEICKIPVCSMSHDQMSDLLKSSVAVSLVVLPASADGSARRGCAFPSCGAPPPPPSDYENVPGGGGGTAGARQPASRQQQQSGSSRPGASPPPPSVVSSGYGTGGSGRSTLAGGTMSSTSSGSAERWLDEAEPPPPPLPLRHRQRLPAGRSLDATLDSGQTSNYAAPASLQPRPLEPLQGQGPRKEAFAYIELASMNCGILMEAKNNNSKSTYLTDPDVEVYIPGQGRCLAGVTPVVQSPSLAHSSPAAEASSRSGEQQQQLCGPPTGLSSSTDNITGRHTGPDGRSSHTSSPRHQGGAKSAASSAKAGGGPGEAPSGGRRLSSGATYPGGSPARHGGSVRAGGGSSRSVTASQRGSDRSGYDILDQRPVSTRGEAASKAGRQQTAAPQQPSSRGQSSGSVAHSSGSVRSKRGGGGGGGGGSGGPATRRIANSRSSTDLSGGRGLTRLSSAHLSHAESDQCLSSGGGCSPLGRSRSNRALGHRLGHSSSSSQLGGRPPATDPISDPLTGPLGRPRHQHTGSQQSIESGELPGRRPLASRSEDELSAHSLSPTLRRRLRADASTPSSASGRSQAGSPRMADSPRLAEVRMRAAAGRRASSGGYLQTELQRILAEADSLGPFPGAAADLSSGLAPGLSAGAGSGVSSSRESPLEEVETNVLLTTARPAQVVRTASQGPDLPPAPSAVPLPAGQVDWQALVDTATRAVLPYLPDNRTPPIAASTPAPTGESSCSEPPAAAGTPAAAGEPSSGSEELRARLTTLENELVSEQSKREVLQSQVHKLSSDNQRLQEESRQAAQQLRKFTQWFLSNVEKP